MSADRVGERLIRHGGIAAVHTEPVTDTRGEVVGWQNVIICRDGHREPITPDEERALIEGPDLPVGFRA